MAEAKDICDQTDGSAEQLESLLNEAFERFVAAGGDTVILLRTMNYFVRMSESKTKDMRSVLGESVQADVLSDIEMHTVVMTKLYGEEHSTIYNMVLINAMIAVFRLVKASTGGGWGGVRRTAMDTIDWMKGQVS